MDRNKMPAFLSYSQIWWRENDCAFKILELYWCLCLDQSNTSGQNRMARTVPKHHPTSSSSTWFLSFWETLVKRWRKDSQMIKDGKIPTGHVKRYTNIYCIYIDKYIQYTYLHLPYGHLKKTRFLDSSIHIAFGVQGTTYPLSWPFPRLWSLLSFPQKNST